MTMPRLMKITTVRIEPDDVDEGVNFERLGYPTTARTGWTN